MWDSVSFYSLHQNRLHIRALEKFLGLNANAFHSIVFFVGDCTFKTEMPPNVLRRGLGNHIRRYQTPILAPEVVAQCARALAELTDLTNRKTAARSHSSALRARRLQEEQPITRPSQPPALPASADPPESLPRGTIFCLSRPVHLLPSDQGPAWQPKEAPLGDGLVLEES